MWSTMRERAGSRHRGNPPTSAGGPDGEQGVRLMVSPVIGPYGDRMWLLLLLVLVVAVVVGLIRSRPGRTFTILGATLAIPVALYGAALSAFHDFSFEEARPPPSLTLRNDSDDAIYLVRAGVDTPDEELAESVRWNGSIRPGKVQTFRLTYPNDADDVCTFETARMVVVESVSGERRYGSNYLNDSGVRVYSEPNTGDLVVRHEWGDDGIDCFGADERDFAWDGERVVSTTPPARGIPGWLQPLLVAGSISVALVAGGLIADRWRAKRAGQSRPCSTA